MNTTVPFSFPVLNCLNSVSLPLALLHYNNSVRQVLPYEPHCTDKEIKAKVNHITSQMYTINEGTTGTRKQGTGALTYLFSVPNRLHEKGRKRSNTSIWSIDHEGLHVPLSLTKF